MRIRRFVFSATLLALVVVGGTKALDRLGWRGFSEPPRTGEQVIEVIQRLGPPHYDSRPDGDSDDDYRLGYTDGLGTRHHLHVKDGVVVEVTYSSR